MKDGFLGLLQALGIIPEILGQEEAAPGLVVCTVVLPMGSGELGETAIFDENGAWRVSRYESRSGAQAGHRAWVIRLKEGVRRVRTVEDSLTRAKDISLVPMKQPARPHKEAGRES